MQIPFDNRYVTLGEGFYARSSPTAVKKPELIKFNDALARELGMATDRVCASAADIFSGNALPEGAEPLAMAYAGHQFGHFNPQLGDGRALLIGEVIDRHGRRRDIALKGSGRTPFSRRGDGKAIFTSFHNEHQITRDMEIILYEMILSL